VRRGLGGGRGQRDSTIEGVAEPVSASLNALLARGLSAASLGLTGSDRGGKVHRVGPKRRTMPGKSW
jgi:hypothetical protein